MSNNKGWFSNFTLAYFLSGFNGIIVAIAIIAFAIILVFAIKDADKEYQKYGYTGINDNVEYDEWTGEIIPKAEIGTYSNDDKVLVNSKGEEIKFSQIKELMAQYKEIQGDKGVIAAEDVEKVDAICNTLFREYLDIDYEIVPSSSGKAYVYKIKGEYENAYFASSIQYAYFNDLITEIIRDKFKKN